MEKRKIGNWFSQILQFMLIPFVKWKIVVVVVVVIFVSWWNMSFHVTTQQHEKVTRDVVDDALESVWLIIDLGLSSQQKDTVTVWIEGRR